MSINCGVLIPFTLWSIAVVIDAKQIASRNYHHQVGTHRKTPQYFWVSYGTTRIYKQKLVTSWLGIWVFGSDVYFEGVDVLASY